MQESIAESILSKKLNVETGELIYKREIKMARRVRKDIFVKSLEITLKLMFIINHVHNTWCNKHERHVCCTMCYMSITEIISMMFAWVFSRPGLLFPLKLGPLVKHFHNLSYFMMLKSPVTIC